MTLGEKLRRTRQERGLTQKQLAGERITRNMLSQIENDLAQPSMRTLEYLADALGVEPGWLMMQEQSGDAQSALTQARELLMGLERCYKETEQYKLAYEYAAAQRSL